MNKQVSRSIERARKKRRTGRGEGGNQMRDRKGFLPLIPFDIPCPGGRCTPTACASFVSFRLFPPSLYGFFQLDFCAFGVLCVLCGEDRFVDGDEWDASCRRCISLSSPPSPSPAALFCLALALGVVDP